MLSPTKARVFIPPEYQIDPGRVQSNFAPPSHKPSDEISPSEE